MPFRIAFVLLIVYCLKVQSKQDLSSPEASVRSFLAAYGKGDFVQATACIENAKYNSAFDPMAKDQLQHPTSFTVSDIQSSTEGDTATVKLKLTMKESRSADKQKIASSVKLHQADGLWRIVAAMPVVDPAHLTKIDFVNAYVWSLADPGTMMPTFWEARNKARAQVCVSNVKQLGIAALFLCEDYDGKFVLKPDKMQKSLNPYLKDREAFHCASDDEGVVSYSINPAIAGVKLTRIKSPKKTVIIYEGMGGKLDFKLDGRAAVAFADGSAKMITKDEAKALSWKP